MAARTAMARALAETEMLAGGGAKGGGGENAGRTRTREDTRRRAAYLANVSAALGKLQEGLAEECERMEEEHVVLLRPQAHVPRNFEPIWLAEPRTFYKVVAAVGNKLVSVFDGTTEYHLGRVRLAPRGACGYAPLGCCSFVHTTPQQAVNAAFPVHAKALHAPRVLAKVTCFGRGYVDVRRYEKFAFPYVRVDKFITDAVEGFGIIVDTTNLLRDRYSFVDRETV